MHRNSMPRVDEEDDVPLTPSLHRIISERASANPSYYAERVTRDEMERIQTECYRYSSDAIMMEDSSVARRDRHAGLGSVEAARQWNMSPKLAAPRQQSYGYGTNKGFSYLDKMNRSIADPSRRDTQKDISRAEEAARRWDASSGGATKRKADSGRTSRTRSGEGGGSTVIITDEMTDPAVKGPVRSIEAARQWDESATKRTTKPKFGQGKFDPGNTRGCTYRETPDFIRSSLPATADRVLRNSSPDKPLSSQRHQRKSANAPPPYPSPAPTPIPASRSAARSLSFAANVPKNRHKKDPDHSADLSDSLHLMKIIATRSQSEPINNKSLVARRMDDGTELGAKCEDHDLSLGAGTRTKITEVSSARCNQRRSALAPQTATCDRGRGRDGAEDARLDHDLKAKRDGHSKATLMYSAPDDVKMRPCRPHQGSKSELVMDTEDVGQMVDLCHDTNDILSDSAHLMQVVVRRSQTEPIVDATNQILRAATTESDSVEGNSDDRDHIKSASLTRAPSAPEQEYDHRGRLLKSSVTSHNSDFEKPGAYSDSPGGEHKRLGSTRRLYHLLGSLTVGSQRRLPRMLSSTSLTVEATERSSLDASCRRLMTTLPYAREDNENRKQEEENTCSNKRIMVGFLLVVLVVVILALTIPLCLLLDDDPSQDHSHGEQISPPQDTLDGSLVPNLTHMTLEALKDPESPQFMAYRWILKDPNWDTYEVWRKQQRFAMMCTYYALGGPILGGDSVYHRGDSMSPSHHLNECHWLDRRQPACVDEEGPVKRLTFASYNSRPLKGHVPPEIAFLSHLEVLDFSGNKVNKNLEALLPLNTAGSFPSLKELKLSDCQLFGSLPTTLGHLSSLTTLDLSLNNLNSTICTELGLLSSLTDLSLSSNDFSGIIPSELAELPNLEAVSIQNNPGLEVHIPDGFCKSNGTLMASLSTDWCMTASECCLL